MDYIEKIRHARVVNYFNFNGPYLSNEEQNTDLTIGKSIHTFINRYQNEIKQNYTFIIKFNNDAYSYLSYCIIKNVSSIMGRELDLRYLKDYNYNSKEKEYFKGIKPISLRKALKLKKAILITGYHPICNVIKEEFFSKKFIEIYHPIEIFTPYNLEILQDFYLKKEEDIYCEKIGNWNSGAEFWYNYYKTNGNREDSPYFNKVHIEAFNRCVPISLFKLSGTEKDFSLFDFIIKSSQEGNIHLYCVPADKVDFIKVNLSPYLDCKNMIREENILTETEFDYLSEQENFYSFSYENFKEGEDVSSNC